MDKETLHRRAVAVLQNAERTEQPYPETFVALKGVGLNRYVVSVPDARTVLHWPNGQTTELPASFAPEPKPAAAFDEKGVAEAIARSARGEVDYKGFMALIAKAGCHRYVADFKNDVLTYFGKNDAGRHVEPVFED